MTQTVEAEFAPARLAVLLKHFAEIGDDRESWRVAYHYSWCAGRPARSRWWKSTTTKE